MKALRQLIKSMLKKKVVRGVFAPVRGLEEGSVFPRFVTTEREADDITLDSYYPFSLAGLVPGKVEKGAVGIVAATCDSRALLELSKRKQVDLDQVFIIGFECREDGFALNWCRRCEHCIPSMADVAFYLDGTVSINTDKGEKKVREILSKMDIPIVTKREMSIEMRERALRHQEEDFSRLAQLMPRERLDYWLGFFDRCIKCYGCRNACPLCFCNDCSLEPHKLIVKPGGNPPDRLFHLVRLMHIGPSCVNCGRCEASCPTEIPISRLYHMLYKEISALFDYEAGMDLSPLPLLEIITEEDMKQSEAEIV